MLPVISDSSQSDRRLEVVRDTTDVGVSNRLGATTGQCAERNLCATIPGERVFKGLGVAKRYCRIKVIGDTFLQC